MLWIWWSHFSKPFMKPFIPCQIPSGYSYPSKMLDDSIFLFLTNCYCKFFWTIIAIKFLRFILESLSEDAIIANKYIRLRSINELKKLKCCICNSFIDINTLSNIFQQWRLEKLKFRPTHWISKKKNGWWLMENLFT